MRRKREEGRGKKEEGRRKREEGRRKREEGRRKKEEEAIKELPNLLGGCYSASSGVVQSINAII
ncbi:hypothetical protein QUB60_14265 [Microcoleus sp. A2-C5]|uniref:hypothetical protein n=1 Tax=unclassified Microcoleus TaxID=2642155 RepID=UPI002FD7180F